MFMFRLLLTVVSYAAITIWLNAIRQTVPVLLLWLLIGVQLFLFLTIFVVSSLRMRQCRKPSWWLWIPLILSRINNWELVAIPATIIVTLILSEMNKHVSQERSHFLPSDEDDDAEIEKMQSEVDRLRRDLQLLEDPETICSFGQMAFDGDSVEQDYVEAANWYKIAAEQGHAKSQHNLALMYENGQGVSRDCAEAAKWYQMAAEQGNAGSQNNLAALYESGDGVTQDHVIALDLYRKSARGGDANAASNVHRVEAILELDRQQKIVFAFSDIMADHAPLIGDCNVLPHPKEAILYAIRYVADHFMEKQERTSDTELAERYGNMVEHLNYLFTRLARDWHHIALEDKEAIEKLGDLKTFPDWALPIKQKYIDEGKASSHAFDIAARVLEDKVKSEQAKAR